MSEQTQLKTAVIGVGYLGKFHAEKHKALPEADFLGVVDTDEERARDLANHLGVQAFTDYKELIGKVDAVSIAVPTVHHFQIAKELLLAGIHVLVEKPIASNLQEAEVLVQIANEKNLILEVGHLQRFNSAMREAQKLIKNPIFMEVHRMSPFSQRSTDIDVVLDLMIHDLDLALGLVRSPIKEIHASGVPVITENIDIANARVEFETGAVANFTASRVSIEAMRKFRVFEKNHCYSIDLAKGMLSKAVRFKQDGQWTVDVGQDTFGEQDNLKDEISHFLKRAKSPSFQHPGAKGEDGLKALAAAIQIKEQIEKRLGHFKAILE